jgi:NADH:ubiquinone oxidoreductase subunit F (NADH-binding)
MEHMDTQLALLNKHEDEIKDLNEKTNAVGCFEQKLCALEQHLPHRINEIKAEFKNKLQEQCIYNAKK